VKIGSFGEVLLRVTPAERRVFESLPDRAELLYGGSEFNFCSGVRRLDEQTVFMTVLPDNPLGKGCENSIRRNDLTMDFVKVVPSGRMGLYFLEEGAGGRGSRVIYDREGSAFSSHKLTGSLVDKFVSRIDHFHFTGITPALSDLSLDNLNKILAAVKKKGIPVSFDINYRSKLWNYMIDGKPVNIKTILNNLIGSTDHLIGNESDLQNGLGIDPGKLYIKNEFDLSLYQNLMIRCASVYPHLKTITLSIREAVSTEINKLGAILYVRDINSFFVAPFESGEYRLMTVNGIVDRVGSGDAFAATIVRSLYKFGSNYQMVIDQAFASFVLKHSYRGDQSFATVKEIESFIEGSYTSLISR